jgi:hypothetical protein
MDLATFDKGQYAPFFEAMMAMMEDDMADEDMADEEMMDEDMADDEMMDDMMLLPVGNIEGEDEACTALREELNVFFYDTFSMMLMEMEEGQ